MCWRPRPSTASRRACRSARTTRGPTCASPTRRSPPATSTGTSSSSGASVFWKILPKADLRFNYNYGIKIFTFQSDRDVTRHQFLVAVRGDLTAKLSSTFRIGVEKRDPDSSVSAGLSRASSWAATGSTGPPSGRPLTLVADRSVQESTFGDVPFYVTTSGGLGAPAPVLEQAHGQPARDGGPERVSDQADPERADRLAQRRLLRLRRRARLRDPAVAHRRRRVRATSPGGRTSTSSTSRTTSSPPRSPCSSESSPRQPLDKAVGSGYSRRPRTMPLMVSLVGCSCSR